MIRKKPIMLANPRNTAQYVSGPVQTFQCHSSNFGPFVALAPMQSRTSIRVFVECRDVQLPNVPCDDRWSILVPGTGT